MQNEERNMRALRILKTEIDKAVSEGKEFVLMADLVRIVMMNTGKGKSWIAKQFNPGGSLSIGFEYDDFEEVVKWQKKNAE